VDDAQSLEAQPIRFFKIGFDDFRHIFGLHGCKSNTSVIGIRMGLSS